MSSSKDLFETYNKQFNDKIKNIISEKNLILGPPASGKTFFINNYIKKADESILGLTNIKTTQVTGGQNILNRISDFF